MQQQLQQQEQQEKITNLFLDGWQPEDLAQVCKISKEQLVEQLKEVAPKVLQERVRLTELQFRGLYNLVVQALRDCLKSEHERHRLQAAELYLRYTKTEKKAVLHLTAEDLIAKMREDPSFTPSPELLQELEVENG